MSQLIDASVAYSTALATHTTAKETAKDAGEAVRAMFEALVVSALADSDEEVREAADAVRYCQTEIAARIEAEDGEAALKVEVKEAFRAMREAAKGGDARAAYATLIDAEERLAEVRGEVKDLRKAGKEAEARLIALAEATA